MYESTFIDAARDDDAVPADGQQPNDPARILLSRRSMIAAGLAASAAPATILSAHAERAGRDRVRPARVGVEPSLRDGEVWPGRALPTGFVYPSDSSWMNSGGEVGIASMADPTPVVAGFPWYSSFDYPVVQKGAHWIGLGTSWGTIRALHAVVFRPPSISDVPGAYTLYDQRNTSGCVGFACSRAAALFNRQLYAGDPLYRAALRIDDKSGVDDLGTGVDAGLTVLRDTGAWLVRNGKVSGPLRGHGIRSFRWLFTVDSIMEALGSNEPYVRLLSSWGINYPAEVRMPLTALNRLIRSNSQVAAPVDRLTGGL